MMRGLLTALFLLHWLVVPLAGAGAPPCSTHAGAFQASGTMNEATTTADRSVTHAATSAHADTSGHDDMPCCNIVGHCASAVAPAGIAVTTREPQPAYSPAAPGRLLPGTADLPYRPPSRSS